MQLLCLKYSDFIRLGLILVLFLFTTKPGTASEYIDLVQWLEAPSSSESELEDGKYTQQNLSQLRAYFAPGYFEELNFDDVEIEVKKVVNYQPHEVYLQATNKYQKDVVLLENKLLSNYKAGKPFSDEKILAAEPEKAGLMIAWNNVMRWQYFGYAADITTTFIRPAAPGKKGRLLEGMRGSGDVFRDTTNFYQRVYISGLTNIKGINLIHIYQRNDGLEGFQRKKELTVILELIGLLMILRGSPAW